MSRKCWYLLAIHSCINGINIVAGTVLIQLGCINGDCKKKNSKAAMMGSSKLNIQLHLLLIFHK